MSYDRGGVNAMSWILWAMLLSSGGFFFVFLMSCLRIAKEADERIGQFGPSTNIEHDRLKENAHVGTNIWYHTAEGDDSNQASTTIEIMRQPKKGELAIS